MLKETATFERRLLDIDDGLLIAITIQKPNSIENYLIDCYKYYSDLAEQYILTEFATFIGLGGT